MVMALSSMVVEGCGSVWLGSDSRDLAVPAQCWANEPGWDQPRDRRSSAHSIWRVFTYQILTRNGPSHNINLPRLARDCQTLIAALWLEVLWALRHWAERASMRGHGPQRVIFLVHAFVCGQKAKDRGRCTCFLVAYLPNSVVASRLDPIPRAIASK